MSYIPRDRVQVPSLMEMLEMSDADLLLLQARMEAAAHKCQADIDEGKILRPGSAKFVLSLMKSGIALSRGVLKHRRASDFDRLVREMAAAARSYLSGAVTDDVDDDELDRREDALRQAVAAFDDYRAGNTAQRDEDPAA